jgi:multidrug efflux pump subunit AcrB
VDDAIVVVEAVEHHIERGLPPREATLKAMEEVSGPVVAIALILVAVFVPTAFIPGITGRMYQQFAVTIAVSVVISAFNALTLSPALAAMLLRPRREARGPLGAFFRWFNRWFGRATDGYVRWSGALLRKALLTMILLAAMTGAAGFLGSKLPQGFIPGGSRLPLPRVQLPPRRRCSARRRSVTRSTPSSRRRRVSGTTRGRRLQSPQHGVHHLQRLLLHPPGTVGRAHPRASTRASS